MDLFPGVCCLHNKQKSLWFRLGYLASLCRQAL